MNDALRLIVATAVLVASVSMVAVAPAAAQSDGGLSVDAEAGDANAGETVTISFSVENTGDDTGVVLNITEIPDGWEIQSHENDNGTWNSNENKWIWLTVPGGETVEPSVTMSVPDDAADEYTVGATASTSQTSTDVEATIGVAGADNGTATETSGGSGPGFGVVLTLVAVLAAALLARRQG